MGLSQELWKNTPTQTHTHREREKEREENVLLHTEGGARRGGSKGCARCSRCHIE